MNRSRAFHRRYFCLAWYPLRRTRCNVVREAEGGWYLGVGLGPLYASVGPGRPLP